MDEHSRPSAPLAAGDSPPAEPAAGAGGVTGAGSGTGVSGRPVRSPWRDAVGVTASMRLLERAQDVATVLVGILLVLLAAVLLGNGAYEFVRDLGSESALIAAQNLLDRVLLVLILIEIVHTVVLSLRAHTLLPQPFIVVGLIAVIRKILFLLGNSTPVDSTYLGLLIAMVVVFVGGLIAVHRLTGGLERDL